MSFWGWLEGHYLIVAGLFSFYYGCRGVLIEQDIVRQLKKNDPPPKHPFWTHYIHEFILQIVSSAAGFFALSILYSRYSQNVSDISNAGASVIFLSLLSIIGISGELPYVIKFGKFPSGK